LEPLHKKFLIVGAGPTGLGAAYRLKELGIDDFLVLEADSHAGGLASSFTDPQGFTWDIGGHVHFSHYSYYDTAVDKVLGPDAWFPHVRNSQIWIKNRFVPYPFQNNIHRLPLRDKWSSLWGLVKASFKRAPPPKNFQDWIDSSFGPRIAKIFMVPYNTKVWAHPPHDLGVDWMGERVARVNIRKVLWNTLIGKDMVAWGPNNLFRFPKYGGTGAIWRAMAAYIGAEHVKMGEPVLEVDLFGKKARTAKRTISYDTLISTMPLRELPSLIPSLPETVKQAANKLKFSSVHSIGIGLKGQPPEFIRNIAWMYFPEPDIPYYRATVLSNYGYCVPDPGKTWSLLVEISESAVWNTGLSNPLERAAEALIRTGFIPHETDIVSRWHRKAKYGYPTPQAGRNEILSVIQPFLEQHGFFSRGRFGGWKYEASNQDHTFMQGVELVNRLVTGEPEVTYPTPDVANRGRR